jgi:hypothetical protein
MNAPNDSKLNEMVTAIGILVLVLGTATGNAYVMFAMAIVALVAVAIVGRKSFGWRALLGVTVATVTAIAVAFGVSQVGQ